MSTKECTEVACECAFRSKPITDSGASRSPIPEQADRRFRSKPITDSGASRSPIPEQADRRGGQRELSDQEVDGAG